MSNTAQEAGNPAQMKRMNLERVYRALMAQGAATRAEIAQQTGISITTIRALMEQLRAREEIVEASVDASSGGRRATRYKLHPHKNRMLALFYTDDAILYEIADVTGRTLVQQRVEQSVYASEAYLFDVVDRCLLSGGICAIALGVPGIVDRRTYMHRRGLNDWNVYETGARIEARYGLPTLLENDLNAMAVGYVQRMAQGANAPQQADLTYVQFNNGCVCAGTLVSGRLVRGARQFAGELSDWPFDGDATLLSALQGAKTPQQLAKVAARLICMINCVNNPARIVLGGERLAPPFDLNDVQIEMDRLIPQRVQPALALADACEADYLAGLKALAIDRMVPMLLDRMQEQSAKGENRAPCPQ